MNDIQNMVVYSLGMHPSDTTFMEGRSHFIIHSLAKVLCQLHCHFWKKLSLERMNLSISGCISLVCVYT